MGCVSSSPQGDPAATARNKAINAELAQAKALDKADVKMLLLGAGESGKSTVLKQLKVIHSGGFTREDRASFSDVLFSNTVQTMQVVLESMGVLELRLDSDNAVHGDFVELLDSDSRSENPAAILRALVALWSDPAVKATVAAKSRFQINDSAEYLFDSLPRIMTPGFVPSDDDILRARVRTTGISETAFKIGKTAYRVFDVGGQRSERKKWIHCFEGVDVLLFIIALSEFDQRLYEDETTTRMSEALVLFEGISNSRWFFRSSVIVFFNKCDLLKDKLPKASMQRAFPQFTGDDLNYYAVCEFFKHTFLGLYVQPKPIYHHFVTAIDTSAVKIVVNVVADIISRGMIEKMEVF